MGADVEPALRFAVEVNDVMCGRGRPEYLPGGFSSFFVGGLDDLGEFSVGVPPDFVKECGFCDQCESGLRFIVMG